jgi:hypothetical protein
MNFPHIRLSINKSVMGKTSSKEDFYDLSKRLSPATMTPEMIMEHLTIMGHPICCAELQVDKKTKLCKREASGFVSSQIIGVDIDETTVPFEELQNDDWLKEHASFAYTTPSHTDNKPRYRIIFVLARPITNPDEYRSAVTSMIDKYGGDQSAKDNVRLWFGSPNAKTIVFGKIISDKALNTLVRTSESERNEQRTFDTFGLSKLSIDDVRDMLRYIPAKQSHIQWKKISFAIFDAVGTGDDVMQMLERWSPSTIPYRDLLKSPLNNVRTGTLIFEAKKHGWHPKPGFYEQPPKEALEITNKVETFLCSGYEFRKNQITNITEYRSLDTKKWERITDYWVHSELRRMRAAGLKVNKERIYELLDSDFSPMHEPIKEWFSNLPAWDESQGDAIRVYANLIPPDKNITSMTEKGQRNWNYDIIKKFMVGAVACAIYNKPNHIMPILQGDQGVGKTTFLRHLCPEVLRKDHFYEGMITEDRDNKIKISQCFLVVDDELEGMNKKSIDFIKQTVSSAQHSIRYMYAHFDDTKPRIASFAGSVNKRTFLTDETGSRRFPVIAVGGEINLKKLQELKVELIWAQAYQLYKTGFQYWFDSKDNARVQRWNQQFQKTSLADDLVNTWCRKLENDGKTARLNATDIATLIAKRHFDRHNVSLNISAQFIQDIGRAMARAGYESKASRHQGHLKTGYLCEIMVEPRLAYGEKQTTNLTEENNEEVTW